MTEPPLVVPHPYPGCDACDALLGSWMTFTEPGSPYRSRGAANRIAMEISDHRRQDEAKAPVI